MTLVRYLLDAGPQGAAVSNANSGSSTAALSGGASIFDVAVAAHGPFGMKVTNVAGSTAFRRYPFAMPTRTFQASVIVTIPTLPASGNQMFINFVNVAAGSSRVTAGVNSAGRIVFQGQGGATTQTLNTFTVAAGDKVRLYVDFVGGEANASTLTVKAFAHAGGTWVTQLGSTHTTSAFHGGVDDIAGMDAGIISSSASVVSVGIDDIQLNDGIGPEISDYVEPIPDPVLVHLGSTQPTGVGTADGTKTIAWDNVPGAGSYESLIAEGFDPPESAFDIVDESVISPYTFTGIPVGVWSFGIRAKV